MPTPYHQKIRAQSRYLFASSSVFFHLLLVAFLSSTNVAINMSASALRRPILVTGGNKGIGKAICSKLLKEYPNDVYVLLGSRNVERGQRTIQELRQEHGQNCLLDLVTIDTGSDESVQEAARTVKNLLKGQPLYAICNNAGIIEGDTHEQVVNVNYFGPRRVIEAFMLRPGGRIVNISSGAAPNFVANGCSDGTLREQLAKPWTIPNGIDGLDEICKTFDTRGLSDIMVYGFSKAALSAYTWLLAQDGQSDTDTNELFVAAVTPGWIATDMTVNQGATEKPSKGAIPPVFLLMNEEIAEMPGGLFYGSDCQRSPWHEYRSPGSPPYVGPDGP